MASFWFERVPDIPKVLGVSFLETTKDLAAFEENFDHKLKYKILWCLWLCYPKIHSDMNFSERNKEKSTIQVTTISLL